MNLLKIKLIILIVVIFERCLGIRQYECDFNQVSCGCGVSNVELNQSRIVVGENAIPYSWPMIVSLRRTYRIDYEHFCAGSILNKYFILTAAHCVDNYIHAPSSIKIASAFYNQSDGNAIIRGGEKIFIHPDYIGHKNGFQNDIALLQLNYPLDLEENPFHGQTCLPQTHIPGNMNEYRLNRTKLIVIGWGTRFKSQRNITDILQQTEVFVIENNHSTCLKSFIDSEKQFCAGFYQGGKDVCHDDDGGPVLQWIGDRWEQVGIVSYSRCEISGYPSIYTRLNYYNDWIMSIINKHNASLNITVVEKYPTKYHCDKSKVSCGCGYNDVEIDQSRIVGGQSSISYSWSMIVSLQFDCTRSQKSPTHCCGGTILTESYILTAAHCVSAPWISNITVIGGIHNRVEKNKIIRKVDRIILHPNYTTQFRNDIALLHLSEPLDLNNNPFVTRTCLPRSINSSIELLEYPSNNTKLIVIGWGDTIKNSDAKPQVLQQLSVYSIHFNHSICSNVIFDSQLQFCAGLYQGGKSTCFGDSGGPVLQWIGDRWEQVGITSYITQSCGEVGFPPVFTRLAYYNTWIESILNEISTTTTTESMTISDNQSISYYCNINRVSCGCGFSGVSLKSSTIMTIDDARPSSWPMIVSIRLNGTQIHSCVGTILSPSHILTSAHCVENESLWKISIRIESSDSSSTDGQLCYTDRIHIHFAYKDFDNDIAILHLTNPIDMMDNIIAIPTCLSQFDTSTDREDYLFNGTRLAVVGWRIMKDNQSLIYNKLQQAEVFATDSNSSICRDFNIDLNRQFCATNYQLNKDFIDGSDSGPIFQWVNDRWQQVGFTSSSRYSNIYTRLDYYYYWIESIMNIDNIILSNENIQINQKPERTYSCNQSSSSCGCSYKNVQLTSLGMMNGENAIEHSWSMIVSIRSKEGQHRCTGTIISDSFILTSARCLEKLSNNDRTTIIVAAGINNLLEYATSMRKVDKIYIYDNSSGSVHDIAILHLQYPLDLDIQSIITKTCLPNNKSSFLSNNSKLILVGWKDLDTKKKNLTNVLQQVSVRILNNKHKSCTSFISNDDGQFCATMITSGTGQNLCSSDSGGPIFLYNNEHWEQVGIVSHSEGCSLSGYITIYTKVSSYINWILKIINETSLITSSPSSITTTTSWNSSKQVKMNIILVIFVSILMFFYNNDE